MDVILLDICLILGYSKCWGEYNFVRCANNVPIVFQHLIQEDGKYYLVSPNLFFLSLSELWPYIQNSFRT